MTPTHKKDKRQKAMGRSTNELYLVRNVAAAASFALKPLAIDDKCSPPRSTGIKTENDDRQSLLEETSRSPDQHQQTMSSSSPGKFPGTSSRTKARAEAETAPGGRDHNDDNNREVRSSLLHLNFPRRLMKALSDPELSDTVCWLPHGRSFYILDPKKFSKQVLPKYFKKEAEYRSFTRRLQRWGFKRVSKGNETGSYYHELFQRGETDMCCRIVACHKPESSPTATSSYLPRGEASSAAPNAERKRYLDNSVHHHMLGKKPKTSAASPFSSAPDGYGTVRPAERASTGEDARSAVAEHSHQCHQQSQRNILDEAIAAAASRVPWQTELLRLTQESRGRRRAPSSSDNVPMARPATTTGLSAQVPPSIQLLDQQREQQSAFFSSVQARAALTTHTADVSLLQYELWRQARHEQQRQISIEAASIESPLTTLRVLLDAYQSRPAVGGVGGASSITRPLWNTQHLSVSPTTTVTENRSLPPLFRHPHLTPTAPQVPARPSPITPGMNSLVTAPVLDPATSFAIVEAARAALQRGESISGSGTSPTLEEGQRTQLQPHKSDANASKLLSEGSSKDDNRRPFDPELFRTKRANRRRSSAA